VRASILVILAATAVVWTGREKGSESTGAAGIRPRAATSTPTADAPAIRETSRPGELSPQAQKAMTCSRVFAKDGAEGPEFRGVGYEAKVTSTGMEMKAKGLKVALRPTRLETGPQVRALSQGKTSRPEPNVARIQRPEIIEEYVFENERVEQLFRLEHPVKGEVRVAMAFEHDLPGGKLAEVHADNRTWRDTILLKDAVVLRDERGRNVAAYHTAKVIDARGVEQDIRPTVEKGEVVLTVPDTFLANAEFPVTIDPWLELGFSASGGGVTNTSKVSEGAALAMDNSGNPVIAWSDNSTGNFEIYVRFFNGFEWREYGGSASGAGISNTPGRSSHPSITLNTAGEPFVAWDDDSIGDIEIYVKGFSFSSQQWFELAGSASVGGVSQWSGQSVHPSIAMMGVRRFLADGDEYPEVPVVAWQQDTDGSSDIFLRMFHPGDQGIDRAGWFGLDGSGSGFGISGTPARNSERPKLVVDRWNRPFVAWSDTENGNPEIQLAGLFDTGGGANFAQSHFVAAFDGDDGRTLTSPFYTNSNVTPPAVLFAWNEVSSSMSGGGISATAPGLSLYPSLAIDRNRGDLYVAWEELDATGSNIFVRRSVIAAPTGAPPAEIDFGAWGVMGSANIGTTGEARHPSIGVQNSTSLLGASNAVAFVSWQDDSSPVVPPALPNPEIFVATSAGGAWTDVGMLGSSGAVRGISNTDNFSYFPVIGSDGLGQPVVAWLDGAFGSYDIFVKKFYVTQAVTITDSSQADSLGVLAVGAATADPTVFLGAYIAGEPSAGITSIRLQVEIRPLNAPFIGTQILDSTPIFGAPPAIVPDAPPLAPGSENAVITFNGLPNVQYAWRARTVDNLGRACPWVPFGSNGDNAIDFQIRQPVPLQVPLVSELVQRRTSAASTNPDQVIPTGGTTDENAVVLSCPIRPTDPTDPVRLLVEVIPVGGSFTGTATATGAFAVDGTGAAITTTQALTVANLANGGYLWRVWVEALSGATTAFVEYGGNGALADFIISAPTPTGLDQRRSNGTTAIVQGGQTDEQSVVLIGVVTSPTAGAQVQLEAEIKLVSQPFDGINLMQSAFVPSGSTATIASGFLNYGMYHWRARMRTSTGFTSSWVSFGTNADGQTDFEVYLVPTSGVAPEEDDKDKCGLLGVELFGVLALLALRRRRK
jgi:hypothetical protein